jgi:hypothetical protein
MNEAAIIDRIGHLEGVDVVTATVESGAPEVAWGDTFFIYDPDHALTGAQQFPFATLVTKDYGAFDSASNLNRPGVFRLNVGVSAKVYESLFATGARSSRGRRTRLLSAGYSAAASGVRASALGLDPESHSRHVRACRVAARPRSSRDRRRAIHPASPPSMSRIAGAEFGASDLQGIVFGAGGGLLRRGPGAGGGHEWRLARRVGVRGGGSGV